MRVSLLVSAVLVCVTAPLAGQQDRVLTSRWVGTHLGRPLFLEFYGDTMLVVNEGHVLDFRLSRDSLIAVGDTIIQGRYRLAPLGHLLLDTPDGLITMSQQSTLARPITGRWIGPLGSSGETRLELQIFSGGVVRWRTVPGMGWTRGEWERQFRLITFTWGEEEDQAEEDETKWIAQYDAEGNALLLETTIPDVDLTILRRVFR
jgi:hypothetical protein